MKCISATDLGANLDEVLDSAQSERIVISRQGKPCAVLVGIEDYDAEDLQLCGSEEFWQMIRERRSSGKSLPLAEVEARLANRGKERAKKQSGPKTRRPRS